MTSDRQDEAARALQTLVDRFGVGLARDPDRCHAVLADLVGRPGLDHRSEVQALASVSSEAARLGPDTDTARLVGRVEAGGTPTTVARWAVDTWTSVDGLALPAPTPSGGHPRRVTVGVAAVIAVVAIGAIIAVLTSGPDDDKDGAGGVTNTIGGTATSVEDTVPAGTAVAEFAPTTTSAGTVSRTWTIEDGVFTASVALEPEAGATSVVHDEVVPSTLAALGEPAFSPEPVTYLDGTARFAAVADGQPITLSYTVPLEDETDAVALLEQLYDEWAPIQSNLIGSGGDVPPPNIN